MAGGKLISTGVEFPDATTQTTSGLPLTGGTMTGTIAGFTSTGIDDNATSTAITIDASENVGIGTTSPYTNGLTIGTSDAAAIISSGGNNTHMTIATCGAGGAFRVLTTGGTTNNRATGESMRIDSSGNVLVGTTSKSSFGGLNPTLVVEHSSDGIAVQNIGSGYVGFHTKASAAHSYYAALFQNSTPSGVGSIYCSTTSTSYNTSSDYRLKELDVPMEGSIDRLKLLRPINFAWKVDGSRVDGFLAHEAQSVVPECVTGTKDAMRDEEYEVTPAVMDGETVVTEAVMGTRSVPDYQGIDQSKLSPLTISALQEAITLIEQLTARVTELENA